MNTSSTAVASSNAINKGTTSTKTAVKASPPAPPKTKTKPVAAQSKVNTPPPPPPPNRMPSKAVPKTDKPVIFKFNY